MACGYLLNLPNTLSHAQIIICQNYSQNALVIPLQCDYKRKIIILIFFKQFETTCFCTIIKNMPYIFSCEFPGLYESSWGKTNTNKCINIRFNRYILVCMYIKHFYIFVYINEK